MEINKTDLESIDNLMRKIIDGDNLDIYDIELAKILKAKIKGVKDKKC